MRDSYKVSIKLLYTYKLACMILIWSTCITLLRDRAFPHSPSNRTNEAMRVMAPCRAVLHCPALCWAHPHTALSCACCARCAARAELAELADPGKARPGNAAGSAGAGTRGTCWSVKAVCGPMDMWAYGYVGLWTCEPMDPCPLCYDKRYKDQPSTVSEGRDHSRKHTLLCAQSASREFD